jgi:alpha-D-ribose 1-methylphosphonate 5-triphosphate synthase subunit PhnI
VGYVAAKGGLDAINAAEHLVRELRNGGESLQLELNQLIERQRLAIDRVMGEGGLWAPLLAAMALRQVEGDVIEAAQLLRSHRTLLPRFTYTEPVSVDQLRILRRIVPAYRNPPGPQLLGRTIDYAGRLIEQPTKAKTSNTDAEPATGDAQVEKVNEAPSVKVSPTPHATHATQTTDAMHAQLTKERTPGRLLDLLRANGLAVDRRSNTQHRAIDITREPVRPGCGRSAVLSTMARAETGALVNLWYRNILGADAHLHEITLGEVRHGELPLPVRHPYTGKSVTIGTVRVTEVEAIEDLDGIDEDRSCFDVGYGLVYGHNERKAIAMANLDIAVSRDQGQSSLEQSVLLTTDGLDASGFLEHLKLPHYVTFRSMIERKMAMRSARNATTPAIEEPETSSESDSDGLDDLQFALAGMSTNSRSDSSASAAGKSDADRFVAQDGARECI